MIENCRQEPVGESEAGRMPAAWWQVPCAAARVVEVSFPLGFPGHGQPGEQVVPLGHGYPGHGAVEQPGQIAGPGWRAGDRQDTWLPFDRARSGHGWKGSLHSAGLELRAAVTWLLSADALAAVEVLPVFRLAGRWSWVCLRQGHEPR